MKLNKRIKTSAIAISLLIISGCLETKPEIEPKHAIFTIWIGNSIIATGYETDSFKIKKGMLLFMHKPSGKAISTSINQIYKIEEN